MKSSKLFIFAFLILTLAVAAQTTFAQKKKPTVKPESNAPRTVVDFYKILPAKFFPLVEDIKDRESLIGTENLELGYIGFDNNGPMEPINGQIWLLKRMSGVSMLVISYTDCILADICTESLRFVEYEAGRWTETDAAPPIPDRQKINEIYERKTGRAPEKKAQLIFDVSPSDKSISAHLASNGETEEIYKLEWDGNIFDFAAPVD